MDFGGRPSYATLTISKNADGTLAGKWGSNELSNVKFQDGKLTFTRTVRFGDQDFTMNYSGTLKDGQLTGLMSSDRGEFATNGTRVKPLSPAVGVWDLAYKIGDRDVTARLTVSQKTDGTPQVTWASQFGESTISNIKLQDSKLSFIRKVKFNENEIEMTFTGTVQGDKLTGTSKNEQLEVPVSGTRFGTALIGKWELTVTSERGTRQGSLRIFPDLSGRYEFFGGEIPIKDLKLEGNQVTFALEMGFGDQTFKMDFKGTLDGNALKGQMTSERFNSEVTGKKLAAAAPAVTGTWELTSQSQQGGTRTNTLKIKDNMTATYTSRDTEIPVTDLKIEGNQISFKITRTFNDQQFTMEFKGTVDGTSLKGEFITSRGSRPVTGKKLTSATSPAEPDQPVAKEASQSASAAKSGGTYRALTPADGLVCGVRVAKINFSFGTAPSGELIAFECVNKGGVQVRLELASTKMVDGKIETKQFGTILMATTTGTSAEYRMTEAQIKAVKKYLGF
jgi:hypothetical protein